MQEPVEHGSGQRLVVGEGGSPLRERQVARQHDSAALVALGDDVEEQVCLFTPERQVADFVDDQQPRPDDRAVEELPQAVLLTRRRQLHHQVGGRDEARLDARLRRAVGQRTGDVRLADARWPKQYDVLGPLDEREAGQLLYLRARGTTGETEVILLQRLDARQRGELRERLALAKRSHIAPAS